VKKPLILAAQPTMDRTAVVVGFSTGKSHRITDVVVLPSGKALNVARSLHQLGESFQVIALFAGHNGLWLEKELKQNGISCRGIWMEGENRLAYSVYDPESNVLTEFIEDTDGPVTDTVYKAFEQTVSEELENSSILVISGRGPKGFPVHAYKRFSELAAENQVKVLMDSYGPLFENAIFSGIELIKINAREAGAFLGRNIGTTEAAINGARSFLKYGVNIVILTMGELGAVITTKDESYVAIPPSNQGAAIGSGDAMMAGIVQAYILKKPIEEMIRMGVAMGAANVLVPGAGLFNLDDVSVLYQKVVINRIK
jgi:1-phosphofructokinase